MPSSWSQEYGSVAPLKRDVSHSNLAKYVAEFLGTFLLVLTVGCNVHTGSLGAALSIGSMLMAMVFALGSVSGAHLNPAVTLAVLLSGREKIRGSDAVFYILFQCLGGVVAAFTYLLLVDDAFMMAPQQRYSIEQVVSVEIFFSAALCYTVLNVATCECRPHTSPNGFFGLAIGFTVVSSAIAIGPVSGCSLNPAVSVGAIAASYAHHGTPALLHWSGFVFAPFGGSMLAVVAFFMVRGGFNDRMEYAKGAMLSTPWPVAEEPEEELPPPVVFSPPVMAAPPPPPVVAAPPSPPRGRSPPPPAPLADLPVLTVARPRTLQRRNSALLGKQLDAHELVCGLSWHVKQRAGVHETVDVDVSCCIFGEKAHHRGAYLRSVYFADAKDPTNGITHSGDQVSSTEQHGDMDTETVTFSPGKITRRVDCLIITANIFSQGVTSFSELKKLRVHVSDRTAGVDLCSYDKSTVGEGNALVVAMIYRRGDHWAFQPIDEGYQVGEHMTARNLAMSGGLQKYVDQALSENRAALAAQGYGADVNAAY